jgi:hypothetical protein
VSNIGVEGGVHYESADPNLHGRAVVEMSFPLRHPSSFVRTDKYDDWIDKHIFYTARYVVRKFVQDRVPLGKVLWRRAAILYRRFFSHTAST